MTWANCRPDGVCKVHHTRTSTDFRGLVMTGRAPTDRSLVQGTDPPRDARSMASTCGVADVQQRFEAATQQIAGALF